MSDFYTPSNTRPEGAAAPYLRAIRTHRVLVAAITLLCVVAAAAYIEVKSPRYQATAQILVTPLPETDTNFLGIEIIRDSGDPLRTAQTAASIVDTTETQTAAAKLIGQGFTQARVNEDVAVNPLGESNILAVVATETSPAVAQTVANDFVKAALAVRDQIVRTEVQARLAQLTATRQAAPGQIAALQAALHSGDPTVSLAQTATLPTAPSGPPHWVVVILALIAGFCIGSIVAVLLERFDPRLRESQELVDLYPLPVLTRIPKMTRRNREASQNGFLNMPAFVREAYRSVQIQLDRYYMQLKQDQENHLSRTIMVTSASKGDGKTSSAISLAFSLLGAGHRVILIDCDLRKPDIAQRLGIPDTGGIRTLLSSDVRLQDVLVEEWIADASQLPPLLVLPAGAPSGDATLLETLNRQLPDILHQADELADFVVIDTPPLGEVSDALRLTDSIDDVIVVGRPGVTDRRSFTVMRDLLERAGIAPTGMILVADSTVTSTASYYAYGHDRSANSVGSPE